MAQKVWKLFKSEINELLTITCNVLLKAAPVAVKQKLATVLPVFKTSREDLEDYKRRDAQIGQAGRNSSEEQSCQKQQINMMCRKGAHSSQIHSSSAKGAGEQVNKADWVVTELFVQNKSL